MELKRIHGESVKFIENNVFKRNFKGFQGNSMKVKGI